MDYSGTRTQPASREDLLRTLRGAIAETMPASFCSATGVLTSGLAEYSSIVLKAGDLVTNVGALMSGTVSAVGITLSKIGLYDKLGNRLAASADQGSSWQTIGYKTIPMITPYPVQATDIYYLAMLCVFTTTGPTIPRGPAGTGTSPFSIGGLPSHFYAQTGLADLPNPATFSLANTATFLGPYMNVT